MGNKLGVRNAYFHGIDVTSKTYERGRGKKKSRKCSRKIVQRTLWRTFVSTTVQLLPVFLLALFFRLEKVVVVGARHYVYGVYLYAPSHTSSHPHEHEKMYYPREMIYAVFALLLPANLCDAKLSLIRSPSFFSSTPHICPSISWLVRYRTRTYTRRTRRIILLLYFFMNLYDDGVSSALFRDFLQGCFRWDCSRKKCCFITVRLG